MSFARDSNYHTRNGGGSSLLEIYGKSALRYSFLTEAGEILKKGGVKSRPEKEEKFRDYPGRRGSSSVRWVGTTYHPQQ